MADPLALVLVLAAYAAYKLLPLPLPSRSWRGAGRRCARYARAALLDPRVDLDAVDNALHRELEALAEVNELTLVPVAAAEPLSVRRARKLELVEIVRIVRAVIAIERGDQDLARAELAGVGNGRGMRQLLMARLALLDGRRLGHVPEAADAPELAELLAILLADTQAQLALARGDPTLALRRGVPIPASTRLRALAAANRLEEARRLVERLRPERYATICRLFPNEPVAGLLGSGPRTDRSPYR